jgi:hypothetical protein
MSFQQTAYGQNFRYRPYQPQNNPFVLGTSLPHNASFGDVTIENLTITNSITGPFSFTGGSITGPTGSQGLSITGATGSQGLSITGPTGSQGLSITGATGSQGLSITGATGPAFINSNIYGSFISTATQPAGYSGLADTAAVFSYNTTTASAGGVYITGATGPSNHYSRIVVPKGGTYETNWSVQLDQSGGGNHLVQVWPRINGIQVPDSNSSITVQGPNGETIPFVSYIFELNANDYIEFEWTAADSGVIASYVPATGSYPAIPSIISSVKIIGETVGITGATGAQGEQGYSSGKLYYLNVSSTGSAGSPYAQLCTGAVVGSTQYKTGLTLPSVGSTGTLAKFITDFNDPGVLFIPPGIWNSTLFLSAVAAGGGSPLTDVQVLAKYYKYSTTGSLTFLQQSSVQPITTTSASPYQLSAQFPYTVLETSDRIVMEINAVNTSQPSKSISITGYFQDNTYSNVVTSFSVIQVGPTGPGAGEWIANAADNRLLTSTSSTGANAEANLTFDGSLLYCTGGILSSDFISVGTGATGTITFDSATGFIVNNNWIPSADNTYSLGTTGAIWSRIYVGTGSIHMGDTTISSPQPGIIRMDGTVVPSTSTSTLGTAENVWQSIYVSTGSVFVGPTGALQIDNNGVLASVAGFASPFITVGATNPGQGITLYEQNNILFFRDQFGASGAVSAWDIDANNINNIVYGLTGNVGIGVAHPSNKLDVSGQIGATAFTGASANFGYAKIQSFTGTTVSSTSLSATNGSFTSLTGTTVHMTNATFGAMTGTDMHVDHVESNSGTLSIASHDNITHTVNIGVSNSIQTVNVGTVGLGVTTINLGGVGDTVNVAGNLVYVNSTVTEITNPYFIINEGNPLINNSGIIVSKTGPGGASTGASILVDTSSSYWTTQVGTGPVVKLNQDIGTGASPYFTNLYASSVTGSSANFTSLTGGFLTVANSKIFFDGNLPFISNLGGDLTDVVLGVHTGAPTGSRNVLIGKDTAPAQNASDNVVVGYHAGYGLSTGSYNVFMGSQSATGTTTASHSVGIGYNTNVDGLSKAIVIGSNSRATADNAIVLGANLTGSASGFFVNPIRNSTGPNFLNYNSTTNEVTYNQAAYLYAYDTTTQNPLTTSYTGVKFNTVSQNVGWTHTSGSSFFTGAFATFGIYLATYSLQVHANANPDQTLCAYLELDGTPVAGSARSTTVASNTTEHEITQQVLIQMSAGTHTLQIMMQGTNANISIQPPTQIAPPGSSGSGATLTITRII